MPLSHEKYVVTIVFVNEGYSYRNVAKILHTSRSSILLAVTCYEELHTFNRRPGSGCPSCTSEREAPFSRLQILRERHCTAIEARSQLIEVHNKVVSANTVRIRIHEANLTSRRPAIGPKLTADLKRAHLQFSKRHEHWSQEQWKKVLFSD